MPIYHCSLSILTYFRPLALPFYSPILYCIIIHYIFQPSPPDWLAMWLGRFSASPPWKSTWPRGNSMTSWLDCSTSPKVCKSAKSWVILLLLLLPKRANHNKRNMDGNESRGLKCDEFWSIIGIKLGAYVSRIIYYCLICVRQIKCPNNN